MKKLLLGGAIAALFFLNSIGARAQYCTPTFDCSDVSLTNVVVAASNIDGISDEHFYSSEGCGAVASPEPLDMNKGDHLLLNASFNAPAEPVTVKVWIDWNRDGDFDDTQESVDITFAEPTYANVQLALPSIARVGLTKMRIGVRPDNLGDFSACDNLGVGEFEDYELNISEQACTGAPVAGSITQTSGSTSFCMSGDVSFTATGYTEAANATLQWQSSEDGNTWSNVPGETSATYNVADLAQTTRFRLAAICTTTSDTGTSNEITINVIPTVIPTASITSNYGYTRFLTGDGLYEPVFTANTTNVGTDPTYRWYIDGVEQEADPMSLHWFSLQNFTTDAELRVVVTSNAECRNADTATAVLNFEVVTPSFSLTSSTGGDSTCGGVPITYTIAHNIPAHYAMWYQVYDNTDLYLSGSDLTFSITENSSYDFSATIFFNNMLTEFYNPYYRQLTEAIKPAVIPSVSISSDIADNRIVVGDSMTFTAVPVDGGSSPQYEWYIDDVAQDHNEGSLTRQFLTNAWVKVLLTSDAECPITRTNEILVEPVVPDVTLSSSAGDDPVCGHDTITYTVNTNIPAGYQNTYSVYINDVFRYNTTESTIKIGGEQASYTIRIENGILNPASAYTDNIVTNTLSATIIPTVIPTVTISSNDSDLKIVEGEIIGFTANITNGGSSPSYSWLVNGILAGFDEPALNRQFENSSEVAIALTVDEACALPAYDTVQVEVIEPVVTLISGRGDGVGCSGAALGYTIRTNLPADYEYVYDMWVNGDQVGMAMDDSTFIQFELEDYDIFVELFITAPSGLTRRLAPSNTISETLTPLTEVTGSIILPTALCYLQPATFTATGTDLGSSPAYVWYRNGVEVPGVTSAQYNVSNISKYVEEEISVEITPDIACPTEETLTATETVQATATPDPNTTYSTSSGSTRLCEGDYVTFLSKSAYLSSTTFSWARDGVTIDGATDEYYGTDQPGAITATVTRRGCTRTAAPRVINPLPMAVAGEVGNPGGTEGSFCTNGYTTLQAATNVTGASYRWRRNSSEMGAAATQKIIRQGNYKVTVTKNGCAAVSDPFFVAETETDISVTTDDALDFCTPAFATLQAVDDDAYSYQWYKSSTLLAGETNSSFAAIASGSYRVSISNDGCPALKSDITKVIATVTPVATISRLTKQAAYWMLRAYPTTTGHTYQWYRNDTLITDSVRRDFMATKNGSYSVIATKGACTSAMSAPYLVNATTFSTGGARTVAGIAAGNNVLINVFPNPSTGIFNIGSEELVSIIVKDVQGRMVMDVRNATQVDLSGEAAGMYIMSITNAEGKLLQVERVVKQ
jgi:hypothetical protein